TGKTLTRWPVFVDHFNISASLKREYATENGTALNEALPKLSPLNPQYKTKKKTVFQKVSAFIDKFKGVGGRI
ncbi:TPA: hypothetical protein ACQ29P_005631, partial [Klebsiella pneumoniae]